MGEKISNADQKRIVNCEYYLKTKQIMANAEVYKNLEIGEVYHIKYKDYNNKDMYVCYGWNSTTPSKYMVFHKDGGFVFVKRIIASGNLGKEIVCLTTTYDVGKHWLEADQEYVDSILLEDEEGYDPLAANKKLSNNKNKARRKNKKLQIVYKTPEEAYAYIKTLNVGDSIYDADTAYGSGILTWKIKKITNRKVNKAKTTSSTGWGYSHRDEFHSKHKFADVVVVDIEIKEKVLPRSRSYETKTKELTFSDFLEDRYSKYYKSKLYTVDDV